MCQNCGIRPAALANRTPTKIYYKKHCKTCNKYPNLKEKAKQTRCDGCHKEFHVSQLDVDHISGDRNDNRYENLQILCANCHRLKTHLTKQNRNKEYR